jgi:hypothetical protein
MAGLGAASSPLSDAPGNQTRAGGLDVARAARLRAALWLGLVLLTGILFRAPWMTTPGVRDTHTWKVWTYEAAQRGVGGVYLLMQKKEPPVNLTTIRQAIDGTLPARQLPYRGPTTVWWAYSDYPPGTFYLFWLVGRAYQELISPEFANRPELDAFIRGPVVVAELLTTLLLYWAVRRRNGPYLALATAGSFWLNPALILGGAVLVRLDALLAPALVAGGIALLRGRVSGFWAGWAVGLTLKPQPLFLLPAVCALSARRGWRRLLGYAGLAGAIGLLAALPVLVAGHTLGLLAGVFGNAREPALSYFQFNIWWLVSFLYEATHGGSWTTKTELLDRSILEAQGGPDLQLAGLLLFLLFSLFLIGVWLRRYARAGTDHPAGAAALVLVALQYYGATMLLTSSHENHGLGVLPLLGLAAGWAGGPATAQARRIWLLYGVLSLMVGTDMLMMNGLGKDMPAPLPRMWLGVDASILFTVLNMALFVACCVLWARGAFADPAARAGEPALAGRGLDDPGRGLP